MKYLAALMGVAMLFVLPQARAQQGPDDEYIAIYDTLQQADSLQAAGQPGQALAKYQQASALLDKFQRIFPDWNPTIVNFRKNYLLNKINGLTAQLPPTNAPPMAVTNTTPSAAPDAQAELSALRARLQSLQSDNATLQAKLKEALQAQPAVADTQALAQAQAQIDSLLKENALLRISVTQQNLTVTANPAAESETVKQLKQSLAQANQDLSAQAKRADKLAEENQALQSRLQSLLGSPDAMQALREENAALKKQLAALEATTNPAGASDVDEALAKARAQIAVLQSDADIAWLEKAALEKRLQGFQPVSSTSANAAAPSPEMSGGTTTTNAQTADEMQAEHFTTAPPSDTDEETKSINSLPQGSAALAAEAQSYFAGHQYDQAEADYQKILQLDESNAVALANLAAIEMEENKLADAETHLKAALAQSPDDAFNLSTYGYLKFRQQKYDEALDALSRAARLDPQNPQIQNYLGVTLSHKGLMAEAEVALRKAVQLDPNYGAAHNNLAVVYISEQPPAVELARLEYQRALNLGQPRNLELETMLAAKGATVSP